MWVVDRSENGRSIGSVPKILKERIGCVPTKKKKLSIGSTSVSVDWIDEIREDEEDVDWIDEPRKAVAGTTREEKEEKNVDWIDETN